jgi:hypothetical protein
MMEISSVDQRQESLAPALTEQPRAQASTTVPELPLVQR